MQHGPVLVAVALRAFATPAAPRRHGGVRRDTRRELGAPRNEAAHVAATGDRAADRHRRRHVPARAGHAWMQDRVDGSGPLTLRSWRRDDAFEPRKRKARHAKALRIIHDEAALLFLFPYEDLYATSKRLQWQPRPDEAISCMELRLK
ncbi:MAG: hypothetical protein NVS3B7_03070 [Candidatus Elarobacter sp.]